MNKLSFLTKSVVSLVGVAFSTLQVFVSTASAVEYNQIYTPGAVPLYKQPVQLIPGCYGTPSFEQSQTVNIPNSVYGIPLRVVAPATSGTYPVLIFSHGVYGTNTQQGWLADYLAQHGYIVLSMQASDICTENDMVTPPRDQVFTDRYNHVNIVLNSFTTIQNSLNSSSGQSYTFDTSRVGFVGYSLGAETGLMMMNQANYILRGGRLNHTSAQVQIQAFFLMAGNLGGNTQNPQTVPGLDQSSANLANLTQPMFWVSGGADTQMFAKSSWNLELGAPGGNYYMHAPSMDHTQYVTGGNTQFQTGIEQFANAFFDAKLVNNQTAIMPQAQSASNVLKNATDYSGNPRNTYELFSNNQDTQTAWWGTPLTVNSTYVGYVTHTY